MKILIVANYIPYPPTTGGDLRLFNLLRYISRYHEVSLLSLFNPLTDKDNGASFLRTFCQRVELVAMPKRSRWERRLRLLRNGLRAEPLRGTDLYSEEMADRIQSLTRKEPFDLIDIQRSHMAPYVKAISSTNCCQKILSLHDINYVQYRRIMAVERNWRAKLRLFYMEWLFSKRAMLKYARCFDKCLVVSERDRDILKRAGPDLDISVVPNGVDTKEYSPLIDPSATPTLLMIGKMSYGPNVDGAIFFCEEIFPLVKRQVPNIKLLIVGRDPIKAVCNLASSDVTVTGRVESVIPYYQQSFISVVPLRAASGTRLKILESMALGRPVISTTIGCEGLNVTQGENILIANTPADFAVQTVRLLNDIELRQRLVVGGRRLVETTYDWEIIGQQLLQTYNQLVGAR